MNKKIVKNYVYEGLGFPVALHNVEMIDIDGILHPKIDVRKVSKNVLQSLITQHSRLTGNQVKFIRTYFSKTLREFAKVVNESHNAVHKWENSGNKITSMDVNIESMLRLYIYDQLIMKKAGNKSNFYNCYREITRIFHQAA